MLCVRLCCVVLCCVQTGPIHVVEEKAEEKDMDSAALAGAGVDDAAAGEGKTPADAEVKCVCSHAAMDSKGDMTSVGTCSTTTTTTATTATTATATAAAAVGSDAGTAGDAWETVPVKAGKKSKKKKGKS